MARTIRLLFSTAKEDQNIPTLNLTKGASYILLHTKKPNQRFYSNVKLHNSYVFWSLHFSVRVESNHGHVTVVLSPHVEY